MAVETKLLLGSSKLETVLLWLAIGQVADPTTAHRDRAMHPARLLQLGMATRGQAALPVVVPGLVLKPPCSSRRAGDDGIDLRGIFSIPL